MVTTFLLDYMIKPWLSLLSDLYLFMFSSFLCIHVYNCTALMVQCFVLFKIKKERNQKERFAIHNASQTCSEVLIYIKYEMFNDPGSKVPIWTRSKSNERLNVIRLELFRTVNDFSSAPFHQHYVIFKIIQNYVEMKKWKALLI